LQVGGVNVHDVHAGVRSCGGYQAEPQTALSILDRYVVCHRGSLIFARVHAGWGLFVCMLSMLAGGAVEMVRLSQFKQGHVLTHDRNAIVDMSVFWQIPQYILVGLSEVRHIIASWHCMDTYSLPW